MFHILKDFTQFFFFINFRFQELRRDLQTVISTRINTTNFNIMHIEDYGGETFLSELIASSLLQEFNQALDRCCTVIIIYNVNNFVKLFLLYNHNVFLSKILGKPSKYRKLNFFQLSSESDVPSRSFQIFEVLTYCLIEEYVDYGLELAVQSVPIPEAKTHDSPHVYFFDVIKQVNTIIILYENQVSDTLIPLIM